MTLEKYMKNKGLTAYAFAKLGGWSQQTVLNWQAGNKPSYSNMTEIESLTGGAVKPVDWFK